MLTERDLRPAGRDVRHPASREQAIAAVSAGVVAVLVVVVLSVAVPALAAPSTITLALRGTHPAGAKNHQGTFTATPPLCADGSWVGNGVGTRVFTCADTTGTFTAAFNGELEHAQGAKGPWSIIAGTGRYADIRGKGTVTVDSSATGDGSPGSPEWIFAATWQGVVDSDAVAPSIHLSQATATRLTASTGLIALHVAFTTADNVAGNTVTYSVFYEISNDLSHSGRRSGKATVKQTVVDFKIRPPMGARTIKVEIDAQDPVGNVRRLIRTLKVPPRL